MTLLGDGAHRGRGEAPDTYGGSRRAWHTTGRGSIVAVLGLVGGASVSIPLASETGLHCSRGRRLVVWLSFFRE